jgi:hypothetical protein
VRFHEDVMIWNRGVVDRGPEIAETMDGQGTVVDVAMWWPKYDFGRLLRLVNLGAGCFVEVDR